MPLPTINDVQAVDPVLTNMLIGYQQADDRFIASRLFPAVAVDKDSGTYYIVTKKYFFLDELEQRAPGQPFRTVDYGVSTATYKTMQWAADHPIADETRANSQVPMDLEQLGLRLLAQRSMIRKEVAFAADFMVINVWANDDNNSTTDWDDTASGDPVTDVLTAKRTISNNTGVDPNTMAMGYIVHQALVQHPDIIDRVKYTTAATQGNLEAALAAVFGVGNYWVAKGTYSNTNEAASFSATAIIDDDCLITQVDPGAGIFGATAGKTFVWQPGGGSGAISSYRDDSRHADVIQHKEQWDQATTATDLGYFFADVV
jgi:hypothetical protein